MGTWQEVRGRGGTGPSWEGSCTPVKESELDPGVGGANTSTFII